MKRLVAVVGAVVVGLTLAACEKGGGPTDPSTVNVFVTQNQGSNQNSGGNGGSQSCDNLVGTVDLSVIGGTFSGGKGKVGEPLLLALAVHAVGGAGLPDACLTTPPDVRPSGACGAIAGLVQKLERITVLPSAAGLCGVTACFGGKCDSTTVDVIS